MGSNSESFQHLLEPLQMGDLLLKNRVVMASLTRNRDNVPRDNLHVLYYGERASTGLIVSSILSTDDHSLHRLQFLLYII